MDWYPERIAWQQNRVSRAWTRRGHVDLLPIKPICAFSWGMCLQMTCADITEKASSGWGGSVTHPLCMAFGRCLILCDFRVSERNLNGEIPGCTRPSLHIRNAEQGQCSCFCSRLSQEDLSPFQTLFTSPMKMHWLGRCFTSCNATVSKPARQTDTVCKQKHSKSL